MSLRVDRTNRRDVSATTSTRDVEALVKHVVQIGHVPGPREVVFLAEGAMPYVAEWDWLRVALHEVLAVKLPALVRRKVETILDAPPSRRRLPLLPVVVRSGGRLTVRAVDLVRSCQPPRLRTTPQPNAKTRAAMREATNIRSIRSEADYERGLLEIERLWHARPGSVEKAELEALGALVEAYEERVYPVPNPDPIEAIKFRMEQGGLTSTDLLPIFGTRGRVSEVLNRKRPLTLDMIRQLHYRLGIPLQSLVTPPGWSYADSHTTRAIPRSIGSGLGSPDLSERVDEFLADGFGQPSSPRAPKRRLRQKGARP